MAINSARIGRVLRLCGFGLICLGVLLVAGGGWLLLGKTVYHEIAYFNRYSEVRFLTAVVSIVGGLSVLLVRYFFWSRLLSHEGVLSAVDNLVSSGDRLKRRLTSISRAEAALLVSSVLVSLVLVEFFFRTFLPSQSPFERQFVVEVIRKPFPYVMFGGMPNGELTSGMFGGSGEDRPHAEILNERGYRGKVCPDFKSPSEYRIFMLGGSTVFNGEPPISVLLEALFREHGFEQVNVYNYGVVSSSSGMELARIVFEISELSPDLVLCYNGANDIFDRLVADPRPGYPYNFMAYENNPFANRDLKKYPTFALLAYSSATLRYFFPKFFVRQFSQLEKMRVEVGYGSEKWKNDIAESYLNNLLKCHRVTKTFGANFVGFFQPMMAFKNTLTPAEVEITNEVWKKHTLDARQRILAQIVEAKRNDPDIYLVDLSDIYAENTDTVFRDFIHTRQEVKPIVARAIYKSIYKKFSKDLTVQ